MKLTTPMQITAADSESRTITGRIVAFNEPASASTGKVIFAKGSIAPTDVFLNLEHDRTRRIGKTLSMTMNGDKSIDATFKIANTTAGTDALVEAMDGLRDGFSVELAVNDYEMLKDGTMKVLNSDLIGVALTSEPAIRSARVTKVAATDDENSETAVADADQTKTEGEKTVSESTPETVAAPETVEATASIKATPIATPMFYAKPRNPIVNMGSWVEHSIKAQLNPNSDSALYVKAATDDLGTTNPAFNPTRQLNEIINGLSNATRANIDAISRGNLPDAGLQFQIPKISQVAVVAAVAEEGAVTNTGITSAFLNVDISRFAGRNILTTEIIERSSPDFFNELLSIMSSAMALAQTKAVGTALLAGATQDVTPTANTAAGLLAFTSRSNAAIYGSTQRFARSLIVSPDQWSNIMSYNVSGAPLFNAYQPSNQTGLVTGQSQIGLVAGLNFYVDNSGIITGSGDDSMVVVEPNSYTWYESPNYRLDVNKPSDGTVEISINSYGAIATKIGAGARKFNFT
jgi:phage head maturation protease